MARTGCCRASEAASSPKSQAGNVGSTPRTPLAGPVLVPVLGGGGGAGRVLQSSVRWEEALVQLENYLSFHASLEFTEVTFLLIATWPYCSWCKMTLEKCFEPETSGCLAGGCQSLLRIPPLPACDSLPANEPEGKVLTFHLFHALRSRA